MKPRLSGVWVSLASGCEALRAQREAYPRANYSFQPNQEISALQAKPFDFARGEGLKAGYLYLVVAATEDQIIERTPSGDEEADEKLFVYGPAVLRSESCLCSLSSYIQIIERSEVLRTESRRDALRNICVRNRHCEDAQHPWQSPLASNLARITATSSTCPTIKIEG